MGGGGWSAGSLITLVAVNCGQRARSTPAAWPSRGAAAFLTAGLSDRGRVAPARAAGLPMGVISTLLSLQANVPQYVIQHFLGAAAVGTFAVLAYPFLVGNIAVTAMGQAAAPQFADALRRDDAAAFRRVLLLTMAAARRSGAGGRVTWAGGARSSSCSMRLCTGKHRRCFSCSPPRAAVRYAYLPVGVATTAQRRIGIQLWLRRDDRCGHRRSPPASCGADSRARVRAPLLWHRRRPGLAGHCLRHYSRPRWRTPAVAVTVS